MTGTPFYIGYRGKLRNGWDAEIIRKINGGWRVLVEPPCSTPFLHVVWDNGRFPGMDDDDFDLLPPSSEGERRSVFYNFYAPNKLLGFPCKTLRDALDTREKYRSAAIVELILIDGKPVHTIIHHVTDDVKASQESA